ncbi:MAG: patatin-like phospholipase family protein [Steroidobacteraceae bacterium]
MSARVARFPAAVGCLLTASLALAADVPPVPGAQAETATISSNERPRIGLVLSGGGARGFAHVGVLRVLEQLRIPIDAVAGTSMGAVVGGLYASGMSAAAIEELASSTDWNEAFRDRSPRGDMSFRRKQDDREFLVRFPLGVKSGRLRVPRGLIQGQKLAQILRRETVAVAGVDDFDRLPARFRAVATDLETGERRVLASGDLTEALRASMSAPGVIAPVEMNGRLLVDGGLVENLPVDVAKEMGVDVVIAVDVGYQLVGRRDLNSALAVSNQMLTIMMQHETERQRSLLSGPDILIEPALGNKMSVDFSGVPELVAQGADATRAQAARLEALALDESQWRQYVAAREGWPGAPPDIRFVRTDPGSARYLERVQAELAPAVGRPLDPTAMERHLSHLYGDGNFESLDYKVVRDGELQGIEVSARRKSWGPNYLRFGLELQDNFQGSTSFNAGARGQVTEINRLGAEWQIDLRVGESPRFATEFYQPMGHASKWFVAPHAMFERRNLDILADDERLATFRVRNSEFGLDLGREFGSWGEMRVGVVRGEGSQSLLVGDPGTPGLPPRDDFNRGEFFAQAALDRLDDVYFPRNGELVTLAWNAPRESLGADEDGDRVSVDMMLARSRGRDTYIFSGAAGSHVSGPETAVQDFYTLGGLFNLSGLSPDSIGGPHFAVARVIYHRRIGSGQEAFLNVPIYLGASLELGNIWEDRSDVSVSSARVNGSVFLGFDTFLGPVYLAAGFDEGGGRSFYLLLGRIR